MKKSKIHFDCNLWAGNEITEPQQLIEALFGFSHLDTLKAELTNMMSFMYKNEPYSARNPANALIIYAALRSLLRCSFVLQLNSDKYILGNSEVRIPCSLSQTEFDSPLIVFNNAFTYKSLAEFDLALFEILSYSMSSSTDNITWDLFTPHLHILKMLDASWLVYQRGIKKAKKSRKKE